MFQDRCSTHFKSLGSHKSSDRYFLGWGGVLLFCIFKIYFIEGLLIYNVVLISAVQQSDSVIHIYTFFFIFFSIMLYPRVLNIVPCAIQ